MRRSGSAIFEAIGVFVTAMFVVVLALFITPIIYIGFGYLGGVVVKWFFGGLVADGLNTIFGTDRFHPNQIPMITATLAMIGGYFKSSLTNKKEK